MQDLPPAISTPELARLLPEWLRGYADVLSSAGLWELMRTMGGSSIRVPKRVITAHPLAKALGPDGFAVMVQRDGGNTLHVPTTRRVLRYLRNAAIAREREAGASINTLAIAYQLSARQVQRIVSNPGLRVLPGDHPEKTQ